LDLRFGEEYILNAFFAKSKIQDSHKTPDQNLGFSLNKTWSQFMLKTIKTLKCYQSSHHKMVEYSHENIQTIQSEKTYPRLKKMIDLKLDPQNIELKKTIKVWDLSK
jgi:hypothetical protein